MSVDQLSGYARVSRAFIRLCMDAGCPTQESRLSQKMLLEWLFENYSRVRRRAGLKPMAPVSGVTGATLSKLKMGNAILTILEYSELRSSKLDEKKRIQNVRSMVAIALDRL